MVLGLRLILGLPQNAVDFPDNRRLQGICLFLFGVKAVSFFIQKSRILNTVAHRKLGRLDQ